MFHARQPDGGTAPKLAIATCGGHRVDVSVTPLAACQRCHLEIVVHETAPGSGRQTLEYIADCDEPGAATQRGFELARAFIATQAGRGGDQVRTQST